jgi:flagellar basal body-associated protein FliL
MSQQVPPPPEKGLSESQKSMMRKVKIGIGIIALIVIIALVIFAISTFVNRGDLQFVNFKWTDNHPWFSSAYVHVDGTIFNSGSSTARDVQLVTRIYNSQGTLLKTDTTDIGDISSKEYKNISLDIQYSGSASRVESELEYKPFGS